MGLFSSVVTRLFGTHSERELKAIAPLVEKIESLAETYRAMSDAQLKRDKKPYLEEIVPHIFHLRGGDAIRAEISCPRCGQRMEHYIDYNKEAVYLCSHCL